jgi:hypothetical protein
LGEIRNSWFDGKALMGVDVKGTKTRRTKRETKGKRGLALLRRFHADGCKVSVADLEDASIDVHLRARDACVRRIRTATGLLEEFGFGLRGVQPTVETRQTEQTSNNRK